MNNQFIEKSMYRYNYIAHSKASFHLESIDSCFSIPDDSQRNKVVREMVKSLVEGGEFCLLPHRISLLRGMDMASVKNTGRALKPMDAQIKGSFTTIEDSPYKCYKPYQVQSGLWKVEGYQSYYAGSLGTSGVNGKIDQDNGDLVVVHTSNWRTLEVFVFRGLAGTQKQLDYLPEVMKYLKGL